MTVPPSRGSYSVIPVLLPVSAAYSALPLSAIEYQHNGKKEHTFHLLQSHVHPVAILQERQLELLGEGRRWFDLIRTGRAMKVMNDYFENYIEAQTGDVCPRFTDEWQLYWPVYYNNILENANLVQNGNY